MRHIIYKKTAFVISLFVLAFLTLSSAFATETPLKIDIDMSSATCKVIPLDILQCDGIKAMWTDPATNKLQSLPGVNVLFQWDSSAYKFQIKEVLGAQCNNTVRVQVASVTTGEPLPNANVALRGQNVVTDEDGIARFSGVQTGVATINITKNGYEIDSIDLTVACDVLKHVAVRLMPKS